MIRAPDLGGVGGVRGVGIDVVDLDRFRRVVARTPRLVDRCFSSAEQAEAADRPDPVATLAGRFAAKEATLKVLAAGIFDLPLAEIELRGAAGEPPHLVTGPTVRRVAGDRGVSAWRVSVTHSELVAAAVVVGIADGGA